MQETLIQFQGQEDPLEKGYPLQYSWASLVAQLVKNPPAMWETRVQSLAREDPLEKGMATHPSILAWRTPRTVYPWACEESDTTQRLSLALFRAGTVLFCPQCKPNECHKSWRTVGDQEICVK